MTKLWRRTPKKQRVQAALTTQFLKAKHPPIQLIGLLRKAKVAVLPAHEYIPVPSNSPAAQQNVARRTALGGRVLTKDEHQLGADLRAQGCLYAERQYEVARFREEQAVLKEAQMHS